jgi:hypothetical protein
MKKINIVILIVCLILVAGVVYFSLTKKDNPEANNGNDQIVGGDKDEHGCIGSAGYDWCEATQKCFRAFEEFCSSDAKDLVEKIKQTTSIELLWKGETNFNWNVYDGENYGSKTISGVLYQIDNIKRADYEKIEKYLTDTYGMDISNVADGVVGGLRGYVAGYMACALGFKHNQLKETPNGLTEIVGDSLTVKLECGYFNSNDIAKILIEQKIKEILAVKYKKTMSDVIVNITKSDETHVAGSVSFLMDGQFSEGGAFLAVKEKDIWNVVFDGNGSINCATMRLQYGFSDEILKPNFCD